MNNSQTERWAYKLIETGRKMQGGIKETAYEIHVENNEFDVIATLDTDSRKANSVAKLIAAAPELLDALQEMVSGDKEAIDEAELLGVPFPEQMLVSYKKAITAIAKATGKKP